MNLSEIIPEPPYSLWVCEWKRNKLKVFCWVRNSGGEKPAKPEPVCFVKHPIYVNEFHESHQRPCTKILLEEVELLWLADYDDYEEHLIKYNEQVNTQKKGISKQERSILKQTA